jgi:integrase/recombinase XerC
MQTKQAPRRIVDAFLSGRKPTTTAAYRDDLESFRKFTQAPDLDAAAFRLIDAEPGRANALALAYKADLMNRGLAAKSINRRLGTLKSLVKQAATLGFAAAPLDVDGLKAESFKDTRGPGTDGFRAMLAAIANRTDTKGCRDRAILRMLFDLALRRGELVSLDLADVDAARGTIRILGKGRSSKETLSLPDPTKAALKAWLDARGTRPGPLFTSIDKHGTPGKRLSGRGCFDVVREIGRLAGIVVRPHGLRHAAITRALDATHGDLRAVAKFSRHRDIRILTVYDDARRDVAGEISKLVAGD